MKRLLIALFAASLPLVALASSGYEEGVDAYRAGQYEKALRIFQERAAKGYGDANYMLSIMYANGQGVPADPVKSREQALIAAERNTPEAIGVVATTYFTNAYGQPDVAKGFHWLERGVALKDGNSMRMLSVRLALGQDIAPDLPRAFRLMDTCRSSGHDPLCQVEFGKMYEFGIATKGELSSARTQYNAARDFDGYAEYRLGRFYELGLGVKQDYARAMDYYLTAAKKHHSGAAMNRIGLMYENGSGVPVDYLQAAGWYEKAADFLDAGGNANGGRLYLEGKGVKRDPAEAVRWFQEAAERSEPVAMRALASLYASGTGVAPEPDKAMHLFCEAAFIDQNHAEGKLEYSVLARPKSETTYRLATLKACQARYTNAADSAKHLASAVSADVIENADALQAKWAKANSLELAMSQDLPAADQ